MEHGWFILCMNACACKTNLLHKTDTISTSRAGRPLLLEPVGSASCLKWSWLQLFSQQAHSSLWISRSQSLVNADKDSYDWRNSQKKIQLGLLGGNKTLLTKAGIFWRRFTAVQPCFHALSWASAHSDVKQKSDGARLFVSSVGQTSEKIPMRLIDVSSAGCQWSSNQQRKGRGHLFSPWAATIPGWVCVNQQELQNLLAALLQFGGNIS